MLNNFLAKLFGRRQAEIKRQRIQSPAELIIMPSFDYAKAVGLHKGYVVGQPNIRVWWPGKGVEALAQCPTVWRVTQHPDVVLTDHEYNCVRSRQQVYVDAIWVSL